MRVIAWILLILSGLEALKALGGTLFGESSGSRFFSLFTLAIHGAAVYVALTYLYFAHTPFKWAIIAVAVANGVGALLSLTEEDVFSRVCGVIVKVLYCVGFILLL